MKLTKQSEADRLADLIQEGYTVDEAMGKVWNRITQNRSDLTMEKVIKEFKLLYGHDPWFYKFLLEKEEIDQTVDEDLLAIFEARISEG